MRFHPAVVLAAMLVAVPPTPLDAQRHTLTGNDVAIYNLVGTITATGVGSGDVVVSVTPRGRDASQLQVESGRIGSSDGLRIFTPSDRIIFPELGRGSRSQLRVGRDGTFFDLDGVARARARNVTIAGSGRGVEAWADVAVAVPPGRTVRLFAAAGRVEVQNVDGNVHVRTSSARAELSQLRGPVEVHTSSGGATIGDVAGSVRVRSSSGRVRLTNARGGHQEVRSSSGSIEARNVTGDAVRITASSGTISGGGITGGEVELRTSSGSIRLDGIDGDRVNARSSSGRIVAQNVRAASIDVGASSGSVELSAYGNLASLSAQTSSGSVRAAIPNSFAGSVDIRTGSGGINVDLPVTVQATRRNELTGHIGQGSGSLRVRTASGSVRITGHQ